MLNNITPVILTYNEAPNIERTLSALRWANRVIIMDSFSDDATETICRNFPNVKFYQRKFDVLADQWEAAIAQEIETEWILALDADYVITQELIEELRGLEPQDHVGGYRTSFIYKIDGQALRGTLYPPVTTVYRLRGASYRQDGHAQRVQIIGEVLELKAKIFHDDRKSKERWHKSQRNYAEQEAKKFHITPFNEMTLNDKIRYVGLGPLIVIPYTLLIRGVVFDGLAGLKYTAQRVIAETYLLKARFF
jgi:glycosyltransferase involved in cell wall biosynthesis